MALKTKSIQVPSESTDGIRICIMRKPKNHTNFDFWMPALAPSLPLLDAYHAGTITWQEYEKRFQRELEECMKPAITLLCDLSNHYDITIVCWELSPENCHRRLVAEACFHQSPELQLTTVIS